MPHSRTRSTPPASAPQADAVVVGGGPAGALTAYLLARQGRRVTLLEAASRVERKLCGEYLCPRGVELLEGLGLSEVAVGRELVGMRVVSPQGRVLTPTFPPHDGRPSRGLALNRQLFERALLARASAAGATVLMGRRLRGLERTSAGWHLRVEHGASSEVHRGALLVGADGRRSTVAGALGLRLQAAGDHVALHGHFHRAERNSDRGEMHLLSDGSYLGVDPTGDHEVNVSLVCSARHLRELGGPRPALRHYLALARDYHARYGPYPHHAQLRAVSPVTHRVSACTVSGAALVGDAAGFIDPLTGEGIFSALWGARALADALACAPAFDPESLETGLREYAAARRVGLEPKWRLHRGFQWLLERPRLIERAGRFLAHRPKRADAFLGVIGNVYRPLEGLVRTLAA
ncbi:MAG: FAD-dependent oxidoreductase [Archangiaceae bacterium]|nr:FAD-dependent oxidoreductase [Archangiaceae bacterium]